MGTNPYLAERVARLPGSPSNKTPLPECPIGPCSEQTHSDPCSTKKRPKKPGLSPRALFTLIHSQTSIIKQGPIVLQSEKEKREKGKKKVQCRVHQLPMSYSDAATATATLVLGTYLTSEVTPLSYSYQQ